jgi:hypothetical protein
LRQPQLIIQDNPTTKGVETTTKKRLRHTAKKEVETSSKHVETTAEVDIPLSRG